MGISPGVYSKIIDLSYYLQEVPGTTGFVSFFSKRGPDNKLTLISGHEEFKGKYGKPNINDYGKKYGQGPYIAWNHLAMSGSLYALRVLPDNASFSNLFVNLTMDSTADISVTSKPAGSINSLDNDLEKDNELMTNGTTYPLIMFYPEGRGDSYNDFGITMEQHTNPVLKSDGVYVIKIYELSSEGDSDDIKESFEVSFDEYAVDEAGESLYIDEVINRYSKCIKCHINEDNLNEWKKTDVPIVFSNASSFQEYPINSGTTIESPAIHLSGGSEGELITIDSITGRRRIDTSIADNLLVEAYYGFTDEKVQNLDEIYFSLVYDAGYSRDVKDAIRYLCEDLRRDCVAIMDNGDNPDVVTSIDTRQNKAPILNTFYAAMYEPFNKIYDIHTGKNIWVSPVYHMSSIIPKNDDLYEIWYPSAGFNRGTIPSIKELRFNPTQGQKDQLYLAQINPIVKFNIGYTIWGNLTSQKRPSKLSNLSTVRSVLYIKRALEQFVKYYVFEFNDSSTHEEVASQISEFLQPVQDARALEGYSVNVGATEYEKKQKIMHCDVVLVPTGIIERVHLNLFIK